MGKLNVAYEMGAAFEFHDFAAEDGSDRRPKGCGGSFAPLNEAVGIRVKTDDGRQLFDTMGYLRSSFIFGEDGVGEKRHMGVKAGYKLRYGEEQLVATGISLLGGYQNTDMAGESQVHALEGGFELTQLFGIDGTNVGRMYIGPSAQVMMATNGDVETDVGIKIYLGG